MQKLEAAALRDLPTAWRRQVYRRTQTADSAHKREDYEQKERARWGKELAGLLLEVDLPFARGLTEAESRLAEFISALDVFTSKQGSVIQGQAANLEALTLDGKL